MLFETMSGILSARVVRVNLSAGCFFHVRASETTCRDVMVQMSRRLHKRDLTVNAREART